MLLALNTQRRTWMIKSTAISSDQAQTMDTSRYAEDRTRSIMSEIRSFLLLERLYLWRLQREHGTPREDPGQSEDTELPVASYPKGDTHADHRRYHPATGKSHSCIALCARCALIS